MGEEYRCFVGGLAWSITDRELEENFRQCGRIVDAKVITDKSTGRSRGFGFVAFADQRGMEAAIERVDNKELVGRVVTVKRATPKDKLDSSFTVQEDQPPPRYPHPRERDPSRERDIVREPAREMNRSVAFADDCCFKCGRLGHWARDCTSSRPPPPVDRYPGRGGDRVHSDMYDTPRSYAHFPPPSADYYYDRYGNGDVHSHGYRDRVSTRYDYRDHRAGGGPLRYDRGVVRVRPGPYDRLPAAFERSGYGRQRIRRSAAYDRY